ncbi:MAG TPA: ABC transporter substrate-binding protein [Acetobacteraceae bacterium]|nr:ABC transporter substrate-binding protein [Acetobacteraceae bacterium]
MSITRRGVLALPGLAALPAAIPVAAGAASPVRIGYIEPLTGNAGSAGQSIKQGVTLALNIINTPHPDLAPLTLAAGAGLTGLGGAPVEVVWADNQGSPAVGQGDALRLITEDHVVALCGAYQSSITLTASAVAERYGIPFVTGESVAANLTERGYKWFFRTTPFGPDFGKLYLDFLADVAKTGLATGKIAIVHENTDYGTSVANSITGAATARGRKIAQTISYNANGTDVSPQVLELKSGNPDVVIFISYTSDSILYMKTFHSLGYRPPIVIGDDSGFSDPAFAKTVGDLAQGALNRSAFVPGKPGSLSYKVNALFKQQTGRDLDDTTARSMQGFFVLCDAINRAGSTRPDAIRAALAATDLPASALMIGYKGVKFDSSGQNTLAYSLMIQLQGPGYVPVWPAEEATAKLELPFKGWT